MLSPPSESHSRPDKYGPLPPPVSLGREGISVEFEPPKGVQASKAAVLAALKIHLHHERAPSEQVAGLGDGERVDAIMSSFFGTHLNRIGRLPSPKAKDAIAVRVADALKTNRPIQGVINWGYFKFSRESSNAEVDLAELMAMEQLIRVNNEVRRFHPPGIKYSIYLEDQTARFLERKKELADTLSPPYMEGFESLCRIIAPDIIQPVRETEMLRRLGKSETEYMAKAGENLERISAYWSESEPLIAARFPAGQTIADGDWDGFCTDTLKSLDSYKRLNAIGWQGFIHPRMREFLRKRQPDLPAAGSMHEGSKYLSTILLHHQWKLFVGEAGLPEYIRFSFVSPLPGAPQSVIDSPRVDLRSVPKNIARSHMPPWACKGLIEVEGETVRPLMRSWRRVREELSESISPAALVLRKGGEELRLKADVLTVDVTERGDAGKRRLTGHDAAGVVHPDILSPRKLGALQSEDGSGIEGCLGREVRDRVKMVILVDEHESISYSIVDNTEILPLLFRNFRNAEVVAYSRIAALMKPPEGRTLIVPDERFSEGHMRWAGRRDETVSFFMWGFGQGGGYADKASGLAVNLDTFGTSSPCTVEVRAGGKEVSGQAPMADETVRGRQRAILRHLGFDDLPAAGARTVFGLESYSARLLSKIDALDGEIRGKGGGGKPIIFVNPLKGAAGEWLFEDELRHHSKAGWLTALNRLVRDVDATVIINPGSQAWRKNVSEYPANWQNPDSKEYVSRSPREEVSSIYDILEAAPDRKAALVRLGGDVGMLELAALAHIVKGSGGAFLNVQTGSAHIAEWFGVPEVVLPIERFGHFLDPRENQLRVSPSYSYDTGRSSTKQREHFAEEVASSVKKLIGRKGE